MTTDVPGAKLIEAARDVRLLLMDCDGVLTDGRLYYGEAGEAFKVFDVRDGLGIVKWNEAGFASGIVSGRSSPVVNRRAEELRIRFVEQGVDDKMAAAAKIFEACGISAAETVYVGDDLPDIELIEFVGLGIAVADAVQAVRDAANYVTEAPGGRGAVREVIDLLLAAKR